MAGDAVSHHAHKSRHHSEQKPELSGDAAPQAHLPVPTGPSQRFKNPLMRQEDTQ